MRVLRIGSCGATAAALLIVTKLSNAAAASSLELALREAYANNPRLEAERASVRALDEEVARAHSGYRPTVSASADIGLQRERDHPSTLGTSGRTLPRSYGVVVSQPLFNGFRTYYGVREAEAGVYAGRAGLVALEATILLEVIKAFNDISRDQALLRLRRANLEYLEREFAANERRRAEGTLTRTDVSQTLAQRATFQSQLEVAVANLEASRAAYQRVVGSPPGVVTAIRPPKFNFPANVEEAIALASRQHPNVVAAVYREDAARQAVERLRGELLPSAQLQATYTHRHEATVLMDEANTATVRGSINIPLYSGGEVEARVRQAKQTQYARLQQITQARADTRAQVSQAWASWQAVKRRLASDEQLVAASTQALDGVRKEERAGQRTVSEVLNAQLALFNADANLTTARHELVFASYSLMSALGSLGITDLVSSVTTYDPEENYHLTHRRWGGLTIRYPNGRTEQLDVSVSKRKADR